MDIKALLKKIETGVDIFPRDFPPGFKAVPRALAAFEGDLNAALVLHETLLPGWPWSIKIMKTGAVWAWTDEAHGLRGFGFSATMPDNPARAWLLATLKAYIAEEGKFE